MSGFRVVRVSDERIPVGYDWLVVRSGEGAVWAFLRASVALSAAISQAIRRAVADLPPFLMLLPSAV